MTDKICVPRIKKKSLDEFVKKAKVKYFWASDWGGNVNLDTDGLYLPIKYKRKELYIKRSYHIYNVPVAWNLTLEIVDEDDNSVTDIPKLEFAIPFWIESDCYESNYDYGDIENYKCNLDELAWEIIFADWNKYLTKRLQGILDKLIANEIDHQVERQIKDVKRMLKDCKGLVEV